MTIFATLPADVRRALARAELRRRRQIDHDDKMVCSIRLEQFTDDELEDVARIGTGYGRVTHEHLEALASAAYVMSAADEAALDGIIRRVKARLKLEGGV